MEHIAIFMISLIAAVCFVAIDGALTNDSSGFMDFIISIMALSFVAFIFYGFATI